MKKPDLDHIIGPLQQFAIPIASINFDKRNARKHSDRNIETIKSSMLQFKQRMPIIVRKETMVVHVGNGRLAAAVQLGWKTIAALVLDETEIDAISYAIADNRTAELAEWDFDVLPGLLKLIQDDQGGNITALGFEDMQILKIIASTTADPTQMVAPDLVGSPKVTLEFGSIEKRDAFKAWMSGAAKGTKSPVGDVLIAKLKIKVDMDDRSSVLPSSAA